MTRVLTNHNLHNCPLPCTACHIFQSFYACIFLNYYYDSHMHLTFDHMASPWLLGNKLLIRKDSF